MGHQCGYDFVDSGENYLTSLLQANSKLSVVYCLVYELDYKKQPHRLSDTTYDYS